MTEEKTQTKKIENPKTEEKQEKMKEEKQTNKEEKKESKADTKDASKEKAKPKVEEKPKVKKEEAIAQGQSLRASPKQCQYICAFIKGKSIDQALKDLGDVINYKRAVPFKGEIPHKKGKGMMSGRYPIKASQMFIPLLKSLRGNAIVNNMDLDKVRIVIAFSSPASRPLRSNSREAKRANVVIKAREVVKPKKKVKVEEKK